MDEEKFAEYKRYVQECVTEIQGEMALGNVNSDEVLLQMIDQRSSFICTLEAFGFFNQHAPYEWHEVVSEEIMKKHNYDLGLVAIYATNSIVFGDVFEALAQTEGYRFLMEGPEEKSVLLPNGNHVIFKEYWKSRGDSFDYLPPLKITNFQGKTLTTYKEGEECPLIYVWEHYDPSLIWVSKK